MKERAAKSPKNESGTSHHFAAAEGDLKATEGSKMNLIDLAVRGNTYNNCTFQYGSVHRSPTQQYQHYQQPVHYYTPPTPTSYRHPVNPTLNQVLTPYDTIPDHILANMPFPGLAQVSNQNVVKKKNPPKNPYSKKTHD